MAEMIGDLIFTPGEDEVSRFHEPDRYESGGDPGGIRTRDLDLERVASWARLDDGVSRFSIPGESARRVHGGVHLDDIARMIPAAVRHPDRDRPAWRLDRQPPRWINSEQAAANHRVFAGLTRRRRRRVHAGRGRSVARG